MFQNIEKSVKLMLQNNILFKKSEKFEEKYLKIWLMINSHRLNYILNIQKYFKRFKVLFIKKV